MLGSVWPQRPAIQKSRAGHAINEMGDRSSIRQPYACRCRQSVFKNGQRPCQPKRMMYGGAIIAIKGSTIVAMPER